MFKYLSVVYLKCFLQRDDANCYLAPSPNVVLRKISLISLSPPQPVTVEWRLQIRDTIKMHRCVAICRSPLIRSARLVAGSQYRPVSGGH